MPPRLNAWSAPTELQTSIPPRQHACSAPLQLYASIAPWLHASSEPLELPASILLSSTSRRLQPISVSPCLHMGTPSACLQSSMPPCLHFTAPTPCLLELYTSIAQRRHTCSATPVLRASMPPRCYQRASRALEFHTSMLPCLHGYSATPDLQTSTSLHRQHVSRGPELHTCMPPRPHACGAPPDLHNSMHSRHYTHNAPSPTLPCLHVTTLHQASIPLYLDVQTSKAPRLHASSAPLELHAIIRLCFYVCTPSACLPELQSSVPPYVAAATPSRSPSPLFLSRVFLFKCHPVPCCLVAVRLGLDP